MKKAATRIVLVWKPKSVQPTCVPLSFFTWRINQRQKHGPIDLTGHRSCITNPLGTITCQSPTQAKHCLLDTPNTMIAGNQTSVAAIMCQTTWKQFDGDQTTIRSPTSVYRTQAQHWPIDFHANTLDQRPFGCSTVNGHPCTYVSPPI